MPDHSRVKTAFLRVMPLLGMGLLAYLLSSVKVSALAVNAKAIGWGMLLVIVIAGFSHVIKTWAWRLALTAEARKIPFARMLGLRLISEAIGQFGFIGLIGGEAARVSILGSDVSVAVAIGSVALDRALFIFAGAVVTIAGVVGLLLAVSVSHATHYYAAALVIGLLLLLIAGAIAIHRRWPVISGLANVAARIPGCRRWVHSKEATFKAAEQRIAEFYHEAPRAFWGSVALNLFCHFLAIMEVYLIVTRLGAPATLLGALILESLTKLINVAGSVNPGNVGTYEGGNMVIGRLVRMTASQGLLLALCRRLRAVFWAIVGGICLLWLSKKRRSGGSVRMSEVDVNKTTAPADSGTSVCECKTAFILAHDSAQSGPFQPILVKVATLPILLRAILNVQSEDTIRTIVVLNGSSGPEIGRQLLSSGRLPAGTEWLEVAAGTTIPEILRLADVKAGRIELVRGNCSYRPNLFRMLHEWNGGRGAIELVSSGKPIGLMALGREMAENLAREREKKIVNETDLHHWIAEDAEIKASGSHPYIEVGEESWQPITRPEDLHAAERKLDQWLVKPTDGIFARMNRRVSIPISRQLIKFPITPNMVSLFTLALSIVAAGFFALEVTGTALSARYWECGGAFWMDATEKLPGSSCKPLTSGAGWIRFATIPTTSSPSPGSSSEWRAVPATQTSSDGVS